MPEERAFGAAVIAIIIGIVGAFTLLSGFFELVVALAKQNWGSFNQTYFFSWLSGSGLSSTAAALIVMVLGLIFLAIATGLYHQHMWALIVMFIFGILFLVGEGSGVVYSMFYANPTVPITNTEILGSIIGIIVVLIVLAYLAAVREDFI
jgi:uncharacterized membrane protein